MATGIPVVTSAHAGASEIIRDGEDGLLISDPQDAGEIARYIQRLIDDPVLRLKLGSQGRKRVEALDWRLFAEKVEAIHLRNTGNKIC
jgi:glycosyltransferase involved in cell wall biosynthesis